MDIYIKQWSDRAVIDYFTMFIQAWIPYNAWYMNQFYDESLGRKSDSDIIYHIGHTDNHYRARIVALLQNEDTESRAFRQLVAALHHVLKAHPMPTGTNPINLDTICISQQVGNKTISNMNAYSVYDIKCEYNRSAPKGTKRIKCDIINRRTSHTKHVIEQFEWNIAEFQTINEFSTIPNADLKKKILETYVQINPKKPTPIIKLPVNKGDELQKPKHSIAIGEGDSMIYITDDLNLVAEVIIHLMYELRCKLFHGEIDPLESYQPVYRYAYEIQMMLNKELR